MKTRILLALMVATMSALGPWNTSVRAGTIYTWNVAGGGNWASAGNWTPAVLPTVDDTAVFSGATPGTVLFNSSRSVGNLTFSTTGWTISDNLSKTMTLDTTTGTAPTITVGTGNTATIYLAVGGKLAGTDGFIKDGAGTLVFTTSGENSSCLSYTGDTNINEGTLQIGNVAATAYNRMFKDETTVARTINVNPNGTLNLAYTNVLGYGVASTTLTKVVINGGLVTSVVADGGSYNILQDLVLKNGGTLSPGTPSTYTGTPSAFLLKGTVSVTTGTNTAASSFTPATDGARVGIGNGAADGGVTTFDVANVTGNSDADLTVGVVVSNIGATYSGALTKTGAGKMTLSQANTYTGETAVSEGVLAISNATGLGTVDAGATVADGAALEISGGISVGEAITLNGTGISNGGALRNTSGNNSVSGTGAITLASASRINSDSGTLAISGSGFYGSGSSEGLAIGGAGNVAISSKIRNTVGAITKDGAGTLTLSNDTSAYVGATTINEGVVAITQSNALGSTAAGTTIADGAALQVSGGISVATEALTINGAGVSGGGALRNTSGNNTWNGAITLAGDSRINSDSGTLLITTNGLYGSGDLEGLTIGGAGNVTISTKIRNTVGAITKDGAGTLTLGSNVNEFVGDTTLNEGTLQLSAQNALQNSTFVGGAGTLVFDNSVGGAFTFGGLGGTTNLALIDNASNAVSLSVGGNNFSTTYSGVLSGVGGSLTKTGSGTLTLTNANTYSGLTAIANGAINIQNSSALGTSGSVSVANASALQVQGGINVGNTLGLDGAGVSSDGGLRSISGNNEWSGAIVCQGTNRNRIASDADMLTISGDIALASTGAADRQLILQGNGDIVITGNITGGLASNRTVVKSATGVGSLTLKGVNTYEGATAVQAGTLTLDGGSAIPDASPIWFNNDESLAATVNLLADETVGMIYSDNSNALLKLNGNRLTTGGYTAIAGSMSGAITGTGGITKIGDTLQTFSGTNTYTGDTIVNAGTLSLAAGGSMAFDINNAGLDFTQLTGAGAGTVEINGAFTFDLADATDTSGSWTVVDVGNLNETYGATFSVTGFDKSTTTAGLWTLSDGSRTWTYAESSGELVVAIPEPGTIVLVLCGICGLIVYAWRRR